MFSYKENSEAKNIAYVRFIVVKHDIRPSTWNKTSTTLLYSQVFPIGLIGDGHDWATEEVQNNAEQLIDDTLKNKEKGYYEITAEYHYESWRCSFEYEEYDSSQSLEKERVTPITYETARSYGSEELELAEEVLISENDLTEWQKRHMLWMREVIVSPYASVRNNYTALIRAYMLCKNSDEVVPDMKSLTLEQMNDLAYMISLDVPAEKLESIKKPFDKILKEHECIFGATILDFNVPPNRYDLTEAEE